MVEPERPQLAIYTAHALCMLDNQVYSTYCVSTATLVTRTRLSVRLYLLCLSVLQSVRYLLNVLMYNVNKNPTDATVCRYLFTAELLYMFRVSQHPSSGVIKTVTAASGTGHNTGTATSLQRGRSGKKDNEME